MEIDLCEFENGTAIFEDRRKRVFFIIIFFIFYNAISLNKVPCVFVILFTHTPAFIIYNRREDLTNIVVAVILNPSETSH